MAEHDVRIRWLVTTTLVLVSLGFSLHAVKEIVVLPLVNVWVMVYTQCAHLSEELHKAYLLQATLDHCRLQTDTSDEACRRFYTLATQRTLLVQTTSSEKRE